MFLPKHMKSIARDATYAPRVVEGMSTILCQVFEILQKPMPHHDRRLSLRIYQSLRETAFEYVTSVWDNFRSESAAM